MLTERPKKQAVEKKAYGGPIISFFSFSVCPVLEESKEKDKDPDELEIDIIN